MIYDITPPITEHLRVWPGDPPLSREILSEISKGDRVTLSALYATSHLGAHADAPSHYGLDAPTIDQVPVDRYLGPCQVIHVEVEGAAGIVPHPVRVDITAPRVLFATQTYPDPCIFNEDFAALSPKLIEGLARSGVTLVGVDTPSVDLFDSEDLPAHRAALAHDIALLEGLRLTEVPEGVYELIALPLPLVGFDASPVRAILRR